MEEDLKKEDEKKMRVDDRLIPDPFEIPHGWLEEDEGMEFWPMLLYPDIFNCLMFYPTQLGSNDLSDYKNSKTYSYLVIINLVGFSRYIFTNYLEVNPAFSKNNEDSLKE